MNEEIRNKIKWDVPEFKKPERGRNWYIITGVIAFILIFFCFFKITLKPLGISFLGNDNNFLFAVIIILSAIIMIAIESKDPKMIRVELNNDGLQLGEKFHDFDDIKNFCILYKPKDSLKNLYFEFKNPTKFRLSIPLRSLNPIQVRNFLKRFLDEDFERKDPPLSEQLTKLLKL